MDVIEKAWIACNDFVDGNEPEMVPPSTAASPAEENTAKKEQGQKGSTEVLAVESSITNENALATDKNNVKSSPDGVLSDAYRIRTESDKNNNSSPVPSSSETKAITSHEAKDNVSEDSQKASVSPLEEITASSSSTNNKTRTKSVAIMNHTCAVFPATFNFAATNPPIRIASTTPTEGGAAESTTQHTSTLTPFITIHPTYITSISGDTLFSVLEEIIASAHFADSKNQRQSQSFVPVMTDTRPSFMDHVRNFAAGLSGVSTSFPIYMLVLLRFQLSLAESFALRDEARISGENKDLSGSIDADSTFDGFKGLMSQISEILKDAETTKAEKIVAKLESDLPGFVGDRNLSCLLLPSFTHVTVRLCLSDKGAMTALQSINSAFASAVDEFNTPAESQAATTGSPEVSDKGIQVDAKVEDGTSEATEPPSTVILNAANAEAGTKKSKKKKKKKVNIWAPIGRCFSLYLFD